MSMSTLRNSIKLGLVVTTISVLLAAAFVIGYETGNRAAEDTGVSTKTLVEQSSPTQPQPTTTIEDAQESTKIPNPHSKETPAPSTLQPSPEPEVNTTVVPGEQANEPSLSDEEALTLLGEVWDIVEDEFFGELPSSEERAYGAIRGMLSTLDDDYTSFSEPSIAAIRREDASGSYGGIGAYVAMNEENILAIVQLFKESPADKAGLRPGDLVLAVDDESIVGYGIYDAITLIRGPEGTEVVLTIQRDDAEPFTVNIVRARLDIPIIESEMLEEGIGYINLFEFSSKATQRMEEALEDLLAEGATSLILDLRGNPGGYLDQAVLVSDIFLDEGLVLVERRSNGQETEFSSTDEGLAQDIPLVVLVGGGSASASEIVAGAIQDRARGILIGEQTFGKGSVQLLHTLGDGSELRVTIARWFTPNDRAIHGEGLTPDIEVLFSPEDQEADRDPQLERAIEYLQTGQ